MIAATKYEIRRKGSTDVLASGFDSMLAGALHSIIHFADVECEVVPSTPDPLPITQSNR